MAREYGHESGFVLPAPEGSGCDIALRFWVPNHEMEMCGHATVGAIWLLDRLGLLAQDHIAISTLSGRVDARIAGARTAAAKVEITQPTGRVQALSDTFSAEVLAVLGAKPDELAPFPIQNAVQGCWLGGEVRLEQTPD